MSRRQNFFVVIGLLPVILPSAARIARADDPPPTAPPPATAPAVPAPAPDFSKGALSGRVLDVVTNQPVANATVALRNKDGDVIAWTRTDADGRYVLAAETLKVLRLEPSRRRGLLSKIVSGIGKVVTAPVKVVGAVGKAAVDTVQQIDPVGTAKAAAVSSVTRNPAPLSKKLGDDVARATQKKAENTLDSTDDAAREAAARSVLGIRQSAPPKEQRKELLPGEVYVSVSAPEYKDLMLGKAGAYWLEPAVKNTETNAVTAGVRARLENVRLAPASSDKASGIENAAVLLNTPRVPSSLVPVGATIPISVQLKVPENEMLAVRVFAREAKKGVTIELKPGENNVYTGDLPLDPKTPVGQSTIVIAALRALPIEVDLKADKDGQDPLLEFARELDDLEADHDFEFDPKIFAAENRLDLPITVLDPKQQP